MNCEAIQKIIQTAVCCTLIYSVPCLCPNYNFPFAKASNSMAFCKYCFEFSMESHLQFPWMRLICKNFSLISKISILTILPFDSFKLRLMFVNLLHYNLGPVKVLLWKFQHFLEITSRRIFMKQDCTRANSFIIVFSQIQQVYAKEPCKPKATSLGCIFTKSGS